MASLTRLYDEILQAVVNEWDVIYDVFPNASTVIQVFVQRIFAQSVKQPNLDSKFLGRVDGRWIDGR